MEATQSDSRDKRCAVVTGGNKGIGLEICRQLASNGILVILTARDDKRGSVAVENLKESGLSNVVFHQLDVTNPSSIASLSNFIQTSFRKLDILVNNAGASGLEVDGEALRSLMLELDEINDDNAHLLNNIMKQTSEKAKECLETNYYGTKGVTEALLPCLQLSDSARIVNISSFMGKLRFVTNEKIKLELNNADGLTEQRLDEVLQWFLEDFNDNKLEVNGWPVTLSAYRVSKVAISAYTRILARKFPHLNVNCVHPGFVKTDITHNTGVLTAEEGARAPVMLALLPDDGPTGQFFDQMNISTFE